MGLLAATVGQQEAYAFEAPESYDVIGSLPPKYKLPPVRFSPNAIKVPLLPSISVLTGDV